MRAGLILPALLLCGAASAQSELVGPGRFPETRGLSALPGGGFGVLPSGRPNFRGAMALSTPIAYSLDRWHWAAGVSATSPTRSFRGLDLTAEGNNGSAGTAFVMFGVPTKYGALAASAMFISVHLDETATNLQFTPKQKGDIKWAIGVQDLFDNTGTTRPLERRLAVSPYVVLTGPLTDGAYASIGYGNQRFGGIFGNLSANVSDWAKLVAEHDTYNWNYGAAFRLGKAGNISGRPIEATLFVGYVRGKYATWSLGLSL